MRARRQRTQTVRRAHRQPRLAQWR